jgi:hypothetical protein
VVDALPASEADVALDRAARARGLRRCARLSILAIVSGHLRFSLPYAQVSFPSLSLRLDMDLAVAHEGLGEASVTSCSPSRRSRRSGRWRPPDRKGPGRARCSRSDRRQ